ncbi:MAG: hypothetical protein JST04_05995 [Bdellovibrionales bacterium]|nr:hypothetical protein [Bdellovibrionales bacterium]
MKSLKILSRALLSLAPITALVLSGCGSSGITGVPDTTQGQLNGEVSTPVDTGGGYGAYPLTWKTIGGSAPVASTALRTDSLLKVKVTLDPATHNENTPVYTNYTANYDCATVSITLQVEVNGVYQTLATVVTDRLTAAGTSGCSGSVASQTIDLSAYMFPGHGNVKITAQAVTSNVNCHNYSIGVGSWPYNYGQLCAQNPMQSIYQYHVVNGKLEVQVNGTDFN